MLRPMLARAPARARARAAVAVADLEPQHKHPRQRIRRKTIVRPKSLAKAPLALDQQEVVAAAQLRALPPERPPLA